MAGRRDLSFSRLDEIMPDVERLLAGHATVGAWSLGQILNHLTTGLRLTLDMPPGESARTREQRVAHRLFFRLERFPEGRVPPVEIMIPRSGLVAETEAEHLRDALERFAAADEPFPAHPALGSMCKDEWTRFHCMHCAHHLGFAVPAEAGSPFESIAR